METYINGVKLTEEQFDYLENLRTYPYATHALSECLRYLENKYGKVNAVVCDFRKFVNDRAIEYRKKLLGKYEESGDADVVMNLLSEVILKKENE